MLFQRIVALSAAIVMVAGGLRMHAAEPADSAAGPRSQAVGLVLSGGGAKGIAHIGVIQALEDNDIPIDYITGTSMGAIVGGLYAAGYTPAEMMALVKSKGFSYWSTGKIDPELTYYFASEPPTPALVHFNLGASDSVSSPFSLLPTSLISPLPMNFAFMDLFAAYTAQCGGDFDRLFVPLRTVTSDVYSKRKIVLGSGSLGDAVRASMSFPLVFRPIEIDSVLVYDGGIYDNYPFNVMHTEFAPDVMIGSNVSGPDTKPKANDVFQQLEDMIIQNNDYSLPPEWGVSITVPVRQFGILEFDKADEIYAIGYRTAMEMMDSIKARVSARIPSEARAMRREVFKCATPYVRFDSVSVTGGTRRQDEYIRYLFTHHSADTFGLARARDSYYRAITPGKLDNLVPQAVYCDSTGLFDLRMKATFKNNYRLGFGGYITSSTASMLYLSAAYRTMSFNSLTASLGGWIGQSYLAASLDARIMITTRVPSSFRFVAAVSRQKFYENDALFFKDDLPTFITDTEAFGRLVYSVAAGRRGLVELGVGGGWTDNRFFPSARADFAVDRRDEAHRILGQVMARYDYSTLDNIHYPTAGTRLTATLMGLTGRRHFKPSAESGEAASRSNITYGQAEINFARYFNPDRRFAVGLEANLLASTRSLADNYGEAIVMAPSFNPTASSYNAFNPAFRANSYATLGIVPIWKITQSVQFRLSGHAFMPYRKIMEGPDRTAFYGRRFSSVRFIGEAALAVTLPFATLSAYADYTSYLAHNWHFGLSLGLFVLAPRFLR